MNVLFLILYVCATIGVSIYLLVLATQFVRAHERIAGALERMVHGQRRE
jgi:hypothetical protein